MPFECLSIVMLDSVLYAYEKYHPQTFLEEFKYKQQQQQQHQQQQQKNYIDEELKSESNTDTDTANEE